MDEPLAFLLTFRTYGTWLHGDERGSVDDDHNVYGTPALAPDPLRLAREQRQMLYPPMVFDDAKRDAVEEAIRDQCQQCGWQVLELAVRTNHVHVLVEYAGVSPETVVGQMKARATRWLRQRGLVPSNAPVWADRPGSRRYLWQTEELDAAAAYVREGQDVAR
jgi:REP element-mobilizing transposase RayT